MTEVKRRQLWLKEGDYLQQEKICQGSKLKYKICLNVPEKVSYANVAVRLVKYKYTR